MGASWRSYPFIVWLEFGGVLTIKFSEAALFLDTYLSLTEAARYAGCWALLRGHVGARVNLMADSPQVSECYGCAVEGRQLLQHRWAELCHIAGIHDLKLHDLRHTAASWLLEAGIDNAVIEKLLGHRLHGMGEGYIHNWEHRLREAVRKLELL